MTCRFGVFILIRKTEAAIACTHNLSPNKNILNAANTARDAGMIGVGKKTVVFIDGANLYSTAVLLGISIDFSRLASFLKETFDVRGLRYYSAVMDSAEFMPMRPLIDWVQYNGYTLVSKQTHEYIDRTTGLRRIKGNMDVEIACDMMMMSQSIEHAILISGDSDFAYPVAELQKRSVLVTAVSTMQSSPPAIGDALRRQVDSFVDIDALKHYIVRPGRAARLEDVAR